MFMRERIGVLTGSASNLWIVVATVGVVDMVTAYHNWRRWTSCWNLAGYFL